jgi:hypothetical protein
MLQVLTCVGKFVWEGFQTLLLLLHESILLWTDFSSKYFSLNFMLLVQETTDEVLNFDGGQMLRCHRFGPRLLDNPLHKTSIEYICLFE